MKRAFLGLMALLVCSFPPAFSQSYVRLIDDSASPETAHPVNTAHPLPVSATVNVGNVAVTSTVNPTGTSLANSTSVNIALTGLAQSQALTAASSNVTISVPSSAANVYISFSGAASSSKFMIPSGMAFTYTGLPAVSTVYFIGASATGNVSIFAH
jgi:hypothetical protein